MAYTTRHSVSKTWPIPRKGTKYLVVPSHDRKNGIPLLVVMRDILGFVKTRKELKKILKEEKVLVNEKITKEEKLSLLLFDTLSLKELGKYYRVSLGENKKINLFEISEKETGHKISKVIGKKILKGKRVQINLHDGRNILSEDKIAVGDSVMVNFKDKKIEKVLHVRKGAKAMVIKGKHMGKMGEIMKVEDGEVVVKGSAGDIKIKAEELIVLN